MFIIEIVENREKFKGDGVGFSPLIFFSTSQSFYN